MLAGGQLNPHKRQPHARGARLILAFFSSSDAAADRILKTLVKRGIRATLSGDALGPSGNESHYAQLRLPGEQLLIAEIPAVAVQPLVDEIRREQPVSTFVIPAAFPVQPEIGAQVLNLDFPWAREAAESKDPAEPSLSRLIQVKLAALESDFENATADLIASANLGHAPGPAANWILENSYLVQSEADEISRSNEDKTPPADPRPNFTQVHALADGLLKYGEHEVTEEAIKAALAAFQQVRPLMTAELWSFGQLLRLALLEELTGLASDAAGAQQRREAA